MFLGITMKLLFVFFILSCAYASSLEDSKDVQIRLSREAKKTSEQLQNGKKVTRKQRKTDLGEKRGRRKKRQKQIFKKKKMNNQRKSRISKKANKNKKKANTGNRKYKKAKKLKKRIKS